MPEMHHQIFIKAAPQTVFDAITNRSGLSSWWTADCEAEPKAESTAVFGFSKRKTVFRMKVQTLEAPHRVGWQCVGDHEEWTGTRLTWELSARDGGTDLRFAHAGWKSADGWFAVCNTTWGALLYRLRDHAEGHKPGPLFEG